MLLLYVSGCEVGGRIAGTFAAIMPLGFYFFVARGGRECATDPLLVTFSTLALYATMRSRHHPHDGFRRGRRDRLRDPEQGSRRPHPADSGGARGRDDCRIRRVSASAASRPSSGPHSSCAAPWYLYEALHNPLFWKTFIGHETLSRFATHLEDETKPATYTLCGLPEGNLLAAPDRDPARPAARQRRSARGTSAGDPKDSSRDSAVDDLAGSGIRGSLRGANQAAMVHPAGADSGRAHCRLDPRMGFRDARLAPQPTHHRGRRRDGAPGAICARARMGDLEDDCRRARQEHPQSDHRPPRADAARELGAGELYFAGAELPALVYYSGLHCNFVQPAEAELIGLGRVNEAPISMSMGDLVLVPIAGLPTMISNLYDVWGVPPPLVRSAESD